MQKRGQRRRSVRVVWCRVLGFFSTPRVCAVLAGREGRRVSQPYSVPLSARTEPVLFVYLRAIRIPLLPKALGCAWSSWKPTPVIPQGGGSVGAPSCFLDLSVLLLGKVAAIRGLSSMLCLYTKPLR